jgi:uncharacterized membrane protein
MSGYGGMISDILMVRGFLISLPFSSIEMITSNHNPFTVLMNCLMFKAVTDVYGYMYIYKYEYKCLCMKYVSPHVINYQHVSITFVITINVALKE